LALIGLTCRDFLLDECFLVDPSGTVSVKKSVKHLHVILDDPVKDFQIAGKIELLTSDVK